MRCSMESLVRLSIHSTLAPFRFAGHLTQKGRGEDEHHGHHHRMPVCTHCSSFGSTQLQSLNPPTPTASFPCSAFVVECRIGDKVYQGMCVQQEEGPKTRVTRPRFSQAVLNTHETPNADEDVGDFDSPNGNAPVLTESKLCPVMGCTASFSDPGELAWHRRTDHAVCYVLFSPVCHPMAYDPVSPSPVPLFICPFLQGQLVCPVPGFVEGF